MSRQEIELDAAEYVIGTLSAEERKAFLNDSINDTQMGVDVQFWEKAFGSLNASIAPEIPPASVWVKIDMALAEQLGESSLSTLSGSTDQLTPANDNAILKGLQKSRSRWRNGALAASVAAIGLALVTFNDTLKIIPPEFLGQQPAIVASAQNYIAVVNANGDEPSLVVNVNAKTGEVTVRSVGVKRPDGKSLELWYVPEGQKAVSVGLVGEGGIDLKDIVAKGGDLLAISLEPSGGSPTGTATGPVIYTGKLIKNIDEE